MQDLWNYCPHCGEKLQAPAHAMQNPAPAANGPARKRVRRPRSDRGKILRRELGK